MNSIGIISASIMSEPDLAMARLGPRFGRLDLQSRLAVAAVAALNIDFSQVPAERIAICMSASAGSLSTDVNFWQGRQDVGGPSPTLFAYTLPSAAVGEVAIHFRLTGPNRCFVGDDKIVLPEAADLIQTGDADGCVAIHCETVTKECGELIGVPMAATAWAVFLKRGGMEQSMERPWRTIDRDMKPLCTLISHAKSAG